jgi:poly(3-hydroxybutyrate) depolymerase
MPVVMVNGTADPMVPYDGGEVGLRGGRDRVWSFDLASVIARLDRAIHIPRPMVTGSPGQAGR